MLYDKPDYDAGILINPIGENMPCESGMYDYEESHDACGDKEYDAPNYSKAELDEAEKRDENWGSDLILTPQVLVERAGIGIALPEDWRDKEIWWNGFSTTIGQLLTTGWELKRKCRWSKSARGRPLTLKGEYWYFTNKHACTVLRIHINSLNIGQSAFAANFMVHRKQMNRTPIRINNKQRMEFEPEDVPALLAIIQDLQKEYPKAKKKTKPLPMAEVIKLVA